MREQQGGDDNMEQEEKEGRALNPTRIVDQDSDGHPIHPDLDTGKPLVRGLGTRKLTGKMMKDSEEDSIVD